GKGVTPRTNANVLIWRALGPAPEDLPMPAEYFRQLGIAAPPKRGDYFVDLAKYLQERHKLDGDQAGKVENEQRRAAQRPWAAREHPIIAGWLKANEKPLAVVVEATKRPGYFNPLVSKKTGKRSAGLLTALLPSVQRCRGLASALL